MMSCELTSGLDFWSRGHLHMVYASSHQVWCKHLIQNGDIAICEIQDSHHTSPGFVGEQWNHHEGPFVMQPL